MKKKTSLRILTTVLLFAAFFCFSAAVQAATCKQTGRTIKTGSYYIWTDYGTNSIRISTLAKGNGSLLTAISSGRNPGTGMVSDGTSVYYVETAMEPSSSGYKLYGYLYCIRTDGTQKTFLKKIRGASDVSAVYNGSIYVSCEDQKDYTLVHTYRYNPKTGKTTRTLKNAQGVAFYKNYLVTMPNSGALVPLPLSVYNTKTGKNKVLSKKAEGCRVIGSKLYYAVNTRQGSFDIYRASVSGSGKKRIASNIRADYIGRVTDKYVFYSRNGRYCRYNLSTKKSKRITMAAYNQGIQPIQS